MPPQQQRRRRDRLLLQPRWQCGNIHHVASTRNAAYVCRRTTTPGTLEVGKFADVLVVEGDPLQDLQVLAKVRLAVHSGVIIREE